MKDGELVGAIYPDFQINKGGGLHRRAGVRCVGGGEGGEAAACRPGGRCREVRAVAGHPGNLALHVGAALVWGEALALEVAEKVSPHMKHCTLQVAAPEQGVSDWEGIQRLLERRSYTVSMIRRSLEKPRAARLYAIGATLV